MSARVIIDFTFFNKGMNIPKCRGSCFFKIRLFGKEEALNLLLCLYFPTADRFSHSPFCLPTAHIAKKIHQA